MKKLALNIGLLCATALVSTGVCAATRDIDASFKRYSVHALGVILADAPSSATLQGDHSHDGEVDDYSSAGRAQSEAHTRTLLAELHAFKRSDLSADNQVDAALLENDLEYGLWTANTLKDWQYDPQIYNEAAGNLLYGLAARDFAPWPQRLHNATLRMERLPILFAQERENIIPERVPAIFATTVAKQNAGVIDIVESMLAPHADTLSAADHARFDAAFIALKKAVADHQHWLDTVLVPRAKGDFRLGAKLYDEKLHFALESPLDRGTIKVRALQAVIDTRAQMYALSRQVLAGKSSLALPELPNDAQQQAAIEAALELTYAKRPARDQVEANARATLVSETEFVRSHDLITLPSAPVNVIEMPKFQQGVAGAYCDPPGALEPQMPTFYAISPIPAEYTDAQATSFLREYNNYMMYDLSVHEAMPGHYVQLAHANQGTSPLRAVLASSPFEEGWAVYAEGMMADEGYLGGDPLYKLTVLKMRLRSVTNSLLDIGVQAEGMTEAQAMQLMTHTAFQQEREAAEKWTRARLTSAQLLSYFVGYSEHSALREEAKQRWGSSYTLKRYNEAVTSHGAPPTQFVRALMFGLPVS